MKETTPGNAGGEPKRRRRRDDGALVTGKFFQLGLAPQRGWRWGKLPQILGQLFWKPLPKAPGNDVNVLGARSAKHAKF